MKSLAIVLLASIASAVPATGAELEPAGAGEAFHSPDAQLAGLIDVMLEESPQIESARSIWRSRLERVPQENSLPDPMLTYRYFGETPETRVGPQRHAIEFGQSVPWRGKRDLQARRASHVASGVAWRIRDLERELVAELKRRYFEAGYLQEALAVNREEGALLERFEDIALTRYSTGEGIQQSVIKVQTDISRLEDQRTDLEQRLASATRAVARLIGRPTANLTLARISLELVSVDIDRDVLENRAIEEHPGVRAVLDGIEADRAWLERSKLESRPDFRFGVSYVEVGDRDDPAAAAIPPEDDGQDVWAVSVGINLPFGRKRVQAGVAEATQSVHAGGQRLRSTRDRLRFAIQEAALRLEAIDERARLYRDVIIPQAEESLASAEAAYTTDRQGFLDLLDAERVLFQVRLTHQRLLADYWIALADMEYGLGRRFPSQRGEE